MKIRIRRIFAACRAVFPRHQPVMLLTTFVAGVAATGSFAQTKLPAYVADMTAKDNGVRHIRSKELNDALTKGMTSQAYYSQIVLARHESYQVFMTGRDKNGQSEVHDNWDDTFFIQEGEAIFVIGGTAPDAKVTAPGERRGTVVRGGKTYIVRQGDYLSVPAGTPHQMLLKPGQQVKFIAFKTRK